MTSSSDAANTCELQTLLFSHINDRAKECGGKWWRGHSWHRSCEPNICTQELVPRLKYSFKHELFFQLIPFRSGRNNNRTLVGSWRAICQAQEIFLRDGHHTVHPKLYANQTIPLPLTYPEELFKAMNGARCRVRGSIPGSLSTSDHRVADGFLRPNTTSERIYHIRRVSLHHAESLTASNLYRELCIRKPVTPGRCAWRWDSTPWDQRECSSLDSIALAGPSRERYIGGLDKKSQPHKKQSHS
ncbi:unnamed protein product [Nezara viridula]|uniref:Uncharacterized protein n=1 Tax=Nezara viridula TaxID=85310 RepID=A0A9P0MVZ9_NEZVI|nr:unnamed protein product [Nezara viridula]